MLTTPLLPQFVGQSCLNALVQSQTVARLRGRASLTNSNNSSSSSFSYQLQQLLQLTRLITNRNPELSGLASSTGKRWIC